MLRNFFVPSIGNFDYLKKIKWKFLYKIVQWDWTPLVPIENKFFWYQMTGSFHFKSFSRVLKGSNLTVLKTKDNSFEKKQKWRMKDEDFHLFTLDQNIKNQKINKYINHYGGSFFLTILLCAGILLIQNFKFWEETKWRMKDEDFNLFTLDQNIKK